MEIQIKDLIEWSQSLDKLVEEKAKKILKEMKTDPYQSEKVDLLSLSLSKAQADFKPIILDKQNPYLGMAYTELNTVLVAVRAGLSQNELALSQTLEVDDDATVTLHTILRHSSGQWIESRSRIVPKKDDIKAFESSVNINKRISILALLGVAVQGDINDDDGEIAMADQRQIIAKGPSTKYNPREQSFERINKTELDEIEYELGQYPDIAETLLEQMNLTSLADLPKSQFRVVIKRAREIVLFRNKGRAIK